MVRAVFFNLEDFLIIPISIVTKAMIMNNPPIKINRINNTLSNMIFYNYCGKLYDNHVIKDIVMMKDVNDPKRRPHPISCVFDFFGRLKVIKSPDIAQQANIDTIKSKLSSNCNLTISKNPAKIVRTKEINFNFFTFFVNIIKS